MRPAYSTNTQNGGRKTKHKTFENYVPSRMKAWQLTNFDGVKNLAMRDTNVPTITSPKTVLVKVKAASLNPLDIMMAKGYGKEILGRLRTIAGVNYECFPLVLGRDFSGEVVDVGMDVMEYAPGDEVWGALFPTSQGSLAEYVAASEYSVFYCICIR